MMVSRTFVHLIQIKTNYEKVHLPIFYNSFVIFTNCTKEDNSDINVLQDDLFGHWEAIDQEIQFLIGNHYCNSFELRENNEFALYYGNASRPSATQSNGTWSIEDGQKIIFNFSRLAVTTKVNRLTNGRLEIVDEGREVVLIKN